jgi:hypothetical protein
MQFHRCNLHSRFKAKVRLSGLLYFHRISNNRKNGFPHYNSSTLKRLVRTESFKNIVLVTTAWDEIEDEETGSLREEQLKLGYWQPLISQGSRIERFKGTRDSAFQLLEPFIDQANERLGFGSIKVRTLKYYPNTNTDAKPQGSDTTESGSDENGEVGVEPRAQIVHATDIGPDDIIIA